MKRIFEGADTTPMAHVILALRSLLLVGADQSESLALNWEVVAAHGVGDGESALSARRLATRDRLQWTGKAGSP